MVERELLNRVSLVIALLILPVTGIFQSEIEGKDDGTKIFAGIEMVKIPAGNTIPEFYMGKYEITQKEYLSVMGKNPSEFQGNPGNPVEMVSWYDAVEFCNKLSRKAGYKPYYKINKEKKDSENQFDGDEKRWTVTINQGADGFRLPTSAEWEYACRAGSTTAFYWGDSKAISVISQYAVYDETSANKGEDHKEYGPHKAGSGKPNAWQLYDMSGNVWEWCFDSPSYDDAPEYCRVLRGGSWNNDSELLKGIYVNDNYPDRADIYTGIRLARNL